MSDYASRSKPPKKFKNLNWITDSYQHIPISFNEAQRQLNRDQPDKHRLMLYELSRLRPNKWVEQRPPDKFTKVQEVKKEFDTGLKLKLKKYSSRPHLKNELNKRREILQKQLSKLSSLKVFDEQLSSRSYNRQEKRILTSVKNNAINTLNQRGKRDENNRKLLSARSRVSRMSNLQQQVESIFKTVETRYPSTHESSSFTRRQSFTNRGQTSR